MNIDVLRKNIDALKKQLKWLQRSYSVCKEAGIKGDYSEIEFDAFETLSGRFSRSVDFLARKVFRSLDSIEFEDPGTLIDVINNAHKRELFSDMDQMKMIRDIRNEIVHEYLNERLKEYFTDILEYTPVLISIINRTIDYSTKYLNEDR